MATILTVIPLTGWTAVQCGPFYLKANAEGLTMVNGREPETQKLTFLKAKDDYDNFMIQLMVPGDGRWLGMDYIIRNKKPMLNVEVIRKNMDEPREFWTYDCRKVK
ncbi:hypothetical protein QS04_09510 [Salmonella enterica subsp. enterica]|nr:hypothetical protein QS04_09510 [Salmonella enterica subsp. enterica] [Salmonella enterica subsp. enterica serovar 4,5,12:b:-]